MSDRQPVERGERRLGGPPRLGEDDDDDDDDDARRRRGDDASHRRLDQRRIAEDDAEAERIAKEYRERYRSVRYRADAADSAPKELFLPGVDDPNIYGVRCKIGRERDLIMSLARKADMLSKADMGQGINIISAFYRESIKGIIYIESRSETAVRHAIQGLVGIYANPSAATVPGASNQGIFLVDIEERQDLLKTKQKKVEVVPGSYVRFKRGKYAGDLAQVLEVPDNADILLLKFIPRIDMTPKDDGAHTGADGKKRRKGSAVPLAFRPPQRLFDPDEVRRSYGKVISRNADGSLSFKNDTYRDGFLEKDVKTTSLSLEDVQPTIDELTRFSGAKGAAGGGGAAGGLDLQLVAETQKKSARTVLQPGDNVEVHEGAEKGLFGTISSIDGNEITIEPDAASDPHGKPFTVPATHVRKRFQPGDHVKVLAGANADESGLVTHVDGETVTFLSDVSQAEVKVFAKDVREAAEASSGVNAVGGYELHDLVQLDQLTVGCVFKIDHDSFRVLDQTGIVRSVALSEMGMKLDTRNAVATDMDGSEMRPGDDMKEIIPDTVREGRKGRVLHVYRGLYVWLHDREALENAGVFTCTTRNLKSPAPSKATRKPLGLNPEVFGEQQQQAQAALQSGAGRGRRDGRLNKMVSITRGPRKGKKGRVKEITGVMARVELYDTSFVVNVPLHELKQVKCVASSLSDPAQTDVYFFWQRRRLTCAARGTLGQLWRRWPRSTRLRSRRLVNVGPVAVFVRPVVRRWRDRVRKQDAWLDRRRDGRQQDACLWRWLWRRRQDTLRRRVRLGSDAHVRRWLWRRDAIRRRWPWRRRRTHAGDRLERKLQDAGQLRQRLERQLEDACAGRRRGRLAHAVQRVEPFVQDSGVWRRRRRRTNACVWRRRRWLWRRWWRSHADATAVWRPWRRRARRERRGRRVRGTDARWL